MNTKTVLFLLLVLHTTWAPDCSYRYIEQPASIFTCNPYSLPSKTLTLTCSVDYFSDVSPAQVEWFESLDRSNNTPMIVRLGGQSPQQWGKYAVSGISGTSLDPDTSRNIVHLSTDLTIMNLTDTDAGLYWCQIFLTNSSQLESSEALSLEPEVAYINDPDCTSSRAPSVVGTICATLLPDPITTNFPSTTQSSTSIATLQMSEQTTQTSSIMVDTVTTDSRNEPSIVFLVAVPTALGLLLLLGVFIGVCTCIVLTRHCKRKIDSRQQKHTSNKTTERAQPSLPIHNNGSQRYNTSASFTNRSYEMDSNPAYVYVQNNHEYLTITDDVEHSRPRDVFIQANGETVRSDGEYVVADLDRSDEPYYVYIN